ncbi:MAG: DUF2249 domain-containing protein, partial [Microthrixaceae bacterium]|nr:DUF2249 domain-containing protein [Microthrixaceae bacterium]
MDANNSTDDTEVLLDVRPMIAKGEEPFSTIMATVASLDGRSLVLLAPFEPTPLEGVLSAQGFTYQAEQISETDWRVRFTPSGANPPAETPTETEPPAPEPRPAEPPATPAEDS